MSRKGGYKIIDLKGLDFSSNMVIDGIHEDIEDNYGKPLLFSGIVIDGVEKDDVFANVEVNGDGYDVTLYGQTLHISNVDVVSYQRNLIELTEINENTLKTLNNGVYRGKFLQDVSYSANKPIILIGGTDDTIDALSNGSTGGSISFGEEVPDKPFIVLNECILIGNIGYER